MDSLLLANTARMITDSSTAYENEISKAIVIAASNEKYEIVIDYNRDTHNQISMDLTELGYTVNLDHPIWPKKITIGWY